MGAADASRRFAYCGLVVGTLPSRRLAVMSLYWQHLATPDIVDELFATYLRTSSVLTSAERGRNRLFIVVFLICHCEEAKRRGNPPKGYHIDVFRINNCTAVKAFSLGEKVSRSDG